MTRTRALTAAAAAALVLGSITTAAVAHADGSANGGGVCAAVPSAIVGTWSMTVTPRNGAPAFHSFVSFQQGGTMTDAPPAPPVTPAFAALGIAPDGATSGLGAWAATGDVVHFTFDRFILQDGVAKVRQEVKGSATVTQDCTVQTGSAAVSFYVAGPDGAQIGQTGLSDTYGTRLMP